jgi:NitT/TauT family transport system permease protein
MISPFSKKRFQKTDKESFSLINLFFYSSGPLLLISIWLFLSLKLEQKWILPTPMDVTEVLLHPCKDILESGSICQNTLISLLRVILGFSLAAITGISLGILIGTTGLIRKILSPLIEIFRPLCPIAWMPFAIAVFGMQTVPQMVGIDRSETIFDQVQTGMVFVLFWGAFFPILINTCDGIKGVRENYVILAESLGAGRRSLIFRVYIPAALPNILTGLRQGLGLSWFVIIAAELLPGTNSGIGYLLFYASNMLEMPVVIACMVVVAVVGASLNGLMILFMKQFISWHGKEI